jgi:hypothetical protein
LVAVDVPDFAGLREEEVQRGRGGAELAFDHGPPASGKDCSASFSAGIHRNTSHCGGEVAATEEIVVESGQAIVRNSSAESSPAFGPDELSTNAVHGRG